MNTLRKHLVIALTAAGLFGAAVGAQAQNTAAPAEGRPALTAEQRLAKKAEWQAKAGERRAKMEQKRAERQARLRDALKLDARQQPAWDAFVASQAPRQHGERARPDRAAWASLSAPQRMEKQIAMQKQRTARMEARLDALNSFYAQLTPEQRKTFDAQAQQRKGPRHHGRGHHGHHGQRASA